MGLGMRVPRERHDGLIDFAQAGVIAKHLQGKFSCITRMPRLAILLPLLGARKGRGYQLFARQEEGK
jgi:hypothetical protein